MAEPGKDKPPKRKRGRPRKTPVDPPKSEQTIDDLAGAAAAAAEAKSEEPPVGDRPPGGEPVEGKPSRRRPRVTKKQTAAIADALAEILMIPAVPAAMFGDKWMADHFTNSGRQLADQIAAVSERNVVLRAWCERAMEGESTAVLLIASLMYVAPPLMHFGIIPGGAMLGVPVLQKGPAAPPGPVPATEQPHTAAREPVPAQQYGGQPVPAGPVATAGEEAVPQREPEPAAPVAETVNPGAHFVGGANGDGPPLWTEQMIGD